MTAYCNFSFKVAFYQFCEDAIIYSQ